MRKYDAIQAAPAIADVETAYRKWRETHIGNRADFYRAMTTPSFSRDVFLLSMDETQNFVGEHFSQKTYK